MGTVHTLRKRPECRVSMLALAGFLLLAGCAPQPVALPDVGGDAFLAMSEAPGQDDFRLARLAVPVPPHFPDDLALAPDAGDEDAFGVEVSPDLAESYRAALALETDRALAALDRHLSRTAQNPVIAWHGAQMRAKLLIAGGRAAEAEELLVNRVAPLEREAFGHDLSATALLGEAALWLGDYTTAEIQYQAVLSAIGDWQLPVSYDAPPANLAALVNMTEAKLRALTGLAGGALFSGQIDLAEHYAVQAEQGFARVRQVADHTLYGAYLPVFGESWLGQANNLMFLGGARLARGEMQQGEAFLRASADLFRALKHQGGPVLVDAVRAWAMLEAGQQEAASGLAAKAADHAAEKGLHDLVWQVQAIRGRTLLAMGRLDEAEQAFQAAFLAIREVTGALSTDRARLRFGAGKDDVTAWLAKFASDRLDRGEGDMAALFSLLDESRARAFADMLGNRLRGGRSGPVARVEKALVALDQKILSMRLQRYGSGPALESNSLEQKRAGLLESLRRLDPELADSHAVTQTRMADVQAALSSRERLVMALPVMDREPLRFLVLQRGSARLVTARATGSAVKQALATLDQGLQSRDRKAQDAALQQLSRLLDVSSWPGKGLDSYIVPAGPLHFIPWGGISGLNGAVAILPRAGWLLYDRSHAFAPEGGERDVLVLGDPDFDGRMPPLPGARKEAEQIAGLWKTPVLTGRAATEQAVQERAGQAGSGQEKAGVGRLSILHLATHGVFDRNYPLNSSLFLARTSPSRSETSPGRLTAAELFESPLPADLVILSACETGLGEVTAGEDFLGLTRSFFLGGSRAVVNSLWQVDDADSRRFMLRFHREIASGQSPGQAWRAAIRELEQAGAPPSSRAAFVLSGRMR